MLKSQRVAHTVATLLHRGESDLAMQEVRRAYLAGEISAAQDREMTAVTRSYPETIAAAQIGMRFRLGEIARS